MGELLAVYLSYIDGASTPGTIICRELPTSSLFRIYRLLSRSSSSSSSSDDGK